MKSSSFIKNSSFILIIVLGILISILSMSSEHFLSIYNFSNILDQASLNLIVAVGMTFVIASGGIDLSVGSTAAMCGAIVAISTTNGINIFFSVLIAIFVSIIIGLVNGILISKFKINPFITTIATMSIVRAATIIIMKSNAIYGFSQSFSNFASVTYLGLTNSFWVCLIIILVGCMYFYKTILGTYTLALGSNETALSRVGIKSGKYKIYVYIISSFLAGITGLLLTSKLNCADPLIGYNLELDVIAIVILGGTNIQGGKASLFGTCIAGIIMAVLYNGLTINSIPSYYQQLLVGIIILIAVLVSRKKS